MQKLISKDFVGPKGVAAKFFFRQEIADECTIQATYKEDEYGFANLKPEPGDLMIDGGGYIGTTAILYAQLYPLARVICVEPMPENVEIIQKNIDTNKLNDRILLIQKALWGSSMKKVKVFYRDESKIGKAHKFIGSSYPDYHESVSKDYFEALTITIADIIKTGVSKQVRVLKLDVEGAEYEILANTIEEDQKKIQTIVGEYHNIRPEKITNPRSLLYNFVGDCFVDKSQGEEVKTWGSFLFERRQ